MQSTLVQQPQDRRDYTFGADSADNVSRSYSWRVDLLPNRRDLRKNTGKVEHQLQYGACSGNAICSALECLLEQNGKFQDLSRLFVYYNSRNKISGDAAVTDCGANLQIAIAECTTRGVALEAIWDYSSPVNKRPSEQAYADAENRKIHRYERLGNGVDLLADILVSLTNRIPVLFGLHTAKPFQTLYGALNKHTESYNPGKIDTGSQDYLGAHGLLIVGFDRTRREFIVENSWGNYWGDRGYAALSFDNVLENGFDFFAIREFADVKTSLNPQYSTSYTGTAEIEPDDDLVEPPAPEQRNNQRKQAQYATATLFFVIAVVIYFLSL